MKIAMVSPYDFTWPGGVTAHVSHLARELGRSGHQVHVLAPHSPSRQCEDADRFVPLGRSVPLPRGRSREDRELGFRWLGLEELLENRYGLAL